MKIRLLQKWMGFIAVLALAAFAVPAYATPMLDFNIDGVNNGTISYAGGIAPLVGVNINVDTCNIL